MGSGKSTVGRILAERYGTAFVDLDRRIEHLFGATVGELFERGEPYFRARERDALVSLLAEPGLRGQPVVVATGGGAVLDEANRVDMGRAGHCVYLRVEPAALAARLGCEERQTRPLLEAATAGQLEAELTELLGRRQASYDACDFVVDADAPPEVVARRVASALEQADHHAD